MEKGSLGRITRCVFDGKKKTENDNQKLIDELYKQIGQLKVENDWFKKRLIQSISDRKGLIDKKHPGISIIKGFYFFSLDDLRILQTVISGEFTITDFQNKNLREKLNHYSSSQISRILKRLHTHGLIKKVSHTYKYYLTRLGSQVITIALKSKELVIIPELTVGCK